MGTSLFRIHVEITELLLHSQALSQLAYRFDQVTNLCTEVYALQSKFGITIIAEGGSSAGLAWEVETPAGAIYEVTFEGLTWRFRDQPIIARVESIVGEVRFGCLSFRSVEQLPFSSDIFILLHISHTVA